MIQYAMKMIACPRGVQRLAREAAASNYGPPVPVAVVQTFVTSD